MDDLAEIRAGVELAQHRMRRHLGALRPFMG